MEAERWLDSPDARELGASEALSVLVKRSRKAIEAAEREKEAARRRELEQAQALAAEAEARRRAEEQRAQEAEAREQEQAQAAKRLLRFAVGLVGVVLLALVPKAGRRFDLSDLFIFAGLAYLSVLAHRNTTLFALGIAPLLGRCLAAIRSAANRATRRLRSVIMV